MIRDYHITIKRFGKANKWILRCSCGHSHTFFTFKGALAEKDLHMVEHDAQLQEPCS
jgi:hypothetical protein